MLSSLPPQFFLLRPTILFFLECCCLLHLCLLLYSFHLARPISNLTFTLPSSQILLIECDLFLIWILMGLSTSHDAYVILDVIDINILTFTTTVEPVLGSWEFFLSFFFFLTFFWVTVILQSESYFLLIVNLCIDWTILGLEPWIYLLFRNYLCNWVQFSLVFFIAPVVYLESFKTRPKYHLLS